VLRDLPPVVRTPDRPRTLHNRNTNTRDAAALTRIIRAREAYLVAEHELEAAILEARTDHVPLRAIAKVLGRAPSSLSEWLARRQAGAQTRGIVGQEAQRDA
jgi:hypothetical protein